MRDVYDYELQESEVDEVRRWKYLLIAFALIMHFGLTIQQAVASAAYQRQQSAINEQLLQQLQGIDRRIKELTSQGRT